MIYPVPLQRVVRTEQFVTNVAFVPRVLDRDVVPQLLLRLIDGAAFVALVVHAAAALVFHQRRRAAVVHVAVRALVVRFLTPTLVFRERGTVLKTCAANLAFVLFLGRVRFLVHLARPRTLVRLAADLARPQFGRGAVYRCHVFLQAARTAHFLTALRAVVLVDALDRIDGRLHVHQLLLVNLQVILQRPVVPDDRRIFERPFTSQSDANARK